MDDDKVDDDVAFVVLFAGAGDGEDTVVVTVGVVGVAGTERIRVITCNTVVLLYSLSSS